MPSSAANCATSPLCHIKLQPKLPREPRNKFLIRLGLRPTQLMVEMNN